MTQLQSAEVLAIVKAATARVKGGGASLMTSGIQNLGAQVHVERETASALELSITSGKRIVELCTFPATVSRDGNRTKLVVGGLRRYKTSQSNALGFIPVGPASIAGMAPYKKFLEEIRTTLLAKDRSATITLAEAGK